MRRPVQADFCLDPASPFACCCGSGLDIPCNPIGGPPFRESLPSVPFIAYPIFRSGISVQ